MSLRRRLSGTVLVAATALAPMAAAAQWQIESKDGQASLKVGFLAQPQMERLETTDQRGTSTNLFLRRFRLLFGGNVSKRWSFFFETDSPNLGKANPNPGATSGAKDQGEIFLQDAYLTFSQSDALKVDAGMLMLPHSRHGTQSAATLLAVDYAPFSFLDSGPSGERFGRDYGVQLRGYPARQHVEYRLAVSQGVRGVEARNALRVSGRVTYYPFGAETGFFYGGTFQGTRKQAGFGAGFDAQEDSRIYSADVFLETPLANKTQGATFQANWMRYDGGGFLAALPEQHAVLVEAAYHLRNHRLSPYVQYNVRRFSDTATPDQDHLQLGLAFWMAGHQRSLKASLGRQHTDGQRDRTMMLVQLQLFYY